MKVDKEAQIIARKVETMEDLDRMNTRGRKKGTRYDILSIYKKQYILPSNRSWIRFTFTWLPSIIVFFKFLNVG